AAGYGGLIDGMVGEREQIISEYYRSMWMCSLRHWELLLNQQMLCSIQLLVNSLPTADWQDNISEYDI
ncbi:hypothetical protein, partial [Halarchaeum acidiphilum]|uniref:hypothetical protein n=1 Tax=Halarchaeum acidiphilum TaxID=489138 RepID=UPI001F4182E5